MRSRVAVPAPPDAVYALIADPAKRPGWMTELRSIEAGSSHVPVEVGDRFSGRAWLLLHELLGISEVTVASPGVELCESVVIGARFTSRWTLSAAAADGSSTEVTHTLDIEFPGGPFGRLERWVLRRRLARIQREGLANLAASFGSPSS